MIPEKVKVDAENTAQAFLELLALRGIDCFFANAGTDFASIVDGFAKREKDGKTLPKPVTVPHEIPLISMAHGYYLVTGRPQAAMVHVGVGTANALGPVMSAQRARIPILFCAGRTPITEEGHPASRSSFVHWAQECFDQAGVIREFVNWDYEIKYPSQLEDIVDRALVMAMSEPKGPVYLTLPREPLYSGFDLTWFNASLRYDLPTFNPDPAKTAKTAELIARADNPLIITSSSGRDKKAVDSLTELAEKGGIGVISFNPEYMNMPFHHYCHQGFSPDPLIGDADLILIIDCDVPWYPAICKPADSALTVNIGIDPLYSRYPVRSYKSDITINSDTNLAVRAIIKELSEHSPVDKDILTKRSRMLSERHDKLFADIKAKAKKSCQEIPMNQAFISSRVNRIIDENTVNVNEYNNQMIWQDSHRAGSYFGVPHAGYLGWGGGAALGIKMAAPEKTVIATIGDGSYMFSVPSACHFVSNAYDLPVLTIVYNNRAWNAVKHAALEIHPEGWASKAKDIPLGELKPSPDYEQICTAFGGYGEKVERPEDLDRALERALHAVRKEKRQACLNVVCG